MAPAWTISASAYQASKGVHQPWIAEISPWQYANMSKRGKARYDERRSREWQASADCKGDFARECVEAYDRGEIVVDGGRWFDHPDLSRDAKDAIWGEVLAREKRAKQATLDKASAGNVPSLETLRIRDTVYDLLCGRYGKVVKLHRITVRLAFDCAPDAPEWIRGSKTSLRGCQWLHFNELKIAAEHGIPIDREALGKVRILQAAELAGVNV